MILVLVQNSIDTLINENRQIKTMIEINKIKQSNRIITFKK